MKLSRTLTLGLVTALAACNPAPFDPGDVVTTTDVQSGTDATSGTDVQSSTDVQSATDTRPGTDAQSGTDAATTGDAAINYGTCGRTVWNQLCVCAAMTSQSAAQACFQMRIGASTTCAGCIGRAQTAACPSQDMAYQTCGMNAQNDSDAGPACTDQACINMRCASQITAYNSCLMAHSMDATYTAAVNACVGDLNSCPM